ncbi:Caffeine resistance protein 5 [Talaromyces pinophilus]|nr:Caffeine resistance protein 5 [Talaromyces pinophilus]
MSDHLRDTVFGQIIRALSGKTLLKFPDEQNPDLWKAFVPKGKHNDGTPTDHDEATNQGAEHTVKAVDSAQPSSSEEQHSLRRDIANRDEKDAEVILVDWYDAKDQEVCPMLSSHVQLPFIADRPKNPQNWSRNRKLLVTFLICILNFGIYVGSSIYTPGEQDIMEEFGASEVVATLGLSLFVLGYGLGPMLFSPMSEIPTIGRSRIYFWTLFVFVLLQLPTGYAANMAMLLVFRFLTGFFGGPVLATGGATIIDMYPPIEVPYWIGIYGASGVLGPVLGPLVGGFAAQAKGWRWPIWELTWLCAVVVIALFFLMPETSVANILYRRAKRLRKQTGKAILKSQFEIDAAEVSVKDHLVVLGRAFTMTVSEPVVFFVDLYCALLYGVLYIWFESFPLVFGELYGFNIGEQGLAFLGIFVGGLITVPCYLFWVRNHLMPRLAQGHFKPEVILPPTFFGAVALPVCLFWYGWTAGKSIHWMVPLVGSGCFTISIITLFMPVLSYLGMAYPQYAASVLAGNTLFRASCGVVFPLFARALFRNLGIGPGNSLLGGLSIAFLPIPFILFYVSRYTPKNPYATTNRTCDIVWRKVPTPQ